jgi:AcrR family transcriptional regulator
MTPRSYTQVRRAESAADTARRIRDSALALYKERGVAATTIQAVAQRADVSRGTVLNHFGGADGLLEAVLDAVVTRLEYPDERILAGARSSRDRINRYVDAMFRFFVRSEDDWPAFSRDLDHPILRRREAEYYADLARLYAATFGEVAEDRQVAAAARAYVNYGPLYDLRKAGLSLEESIELVGDSLVAVAERASRRVGASGKKLRS